MLKRPFCIIGFITAILAIMPMIDTAHADDNATMHSYETTRIICPGGLVGHSYTEYYTWTYKHLHPYPTWECRTEIEDGTGFEFEICEEVHTDHGMTDYVYINITLKRVKRRRDHWSCSRRWP